jgi:Uma2 family endonuclease
LDGDGYLKGSPELVCEIAASSAAVDLYDKFRAYQRNGIAEYLIWLTAEERVLWFQLHDEEFREQEPVDGVLESAVFPGLRLDLKALLAGDRKALAAALLAT